MKKSFFSVFPFFSVFSVVPFKSFKSLTIIHFSPFTFHLKSLYFHLNDAAVWGNVAERIFQFHFSCYGKCQGKDSSVAKGCNASVP
jgi:hypothetical protein